jgi:hypothetical protein
MNRVAAAAGQAEHARSPDRGGDCQTSSIRAAWGAASAAVCARRNFAAATICMAFVIFWVALTEAIRFRRSFNEGMVYPLPLYPGAACASESLDSKASLDQAKFLA